MGQPMRISFVSVATQTTPLDLRDNVVSCSTKDHGGLLEVRFEIRGLEFVNSDLVGPEGQQSSTLTDRLPLLPEVYEVSNSLSLRDKNICPTPVEKENEEEESSPLGATARISPLLLTPVLRPRDDLPVEGTPVVKVPDRNPSCPCVLGPAEMELILPIAALVVLCSASVARKVLIRHQCFGYC